MIPKIIHYCWFGGNLKPELIERCIASWRKYCPEWEIIEWNESNWNVSQYEFAKEAYQAKMWAFVSDVARLDVVFRHGGVYLDTDIELLKPLDGLLNDSAFFSLESGRMINTGLGFGAEKGAKAVGAMLQYYDGKHFIENGKRIAPPCPAWNTEALVNAYPDIKRNGSEQIVNGVHLLSCPAFSKYAINHSTGNWDGKGIKSEEKRAFKSTRLKMFLRDPKKFEIARRYFGKTGESLYTFVAYDLTERGVAFFIKRAFKRGN